VVQSIQLSVLHELSSLFMDPLLGVMLVSFCHLNWSQYSKLITFFGHHWNVAKQKWMPLQLASGIAVPQLLPSFKGVKLKWNEIAAAAMKLAVITIPGVVAMEWLITDILELIWQ
jgi:hypothetical protein